MSPRLAAALLFLAARLFAAGPAPPLRDAVIGRWGFSPESGECDHKPHTIAFSRDGAELHLRYSDPPGQGTYRVLGEAPGRLRLAMRGEKTPDGKPAEWDLVMLNADTYSWHRADWPEGQLTWPVRRCPVEEGEGGDERGSAAAIPDSSTAAILELERRFDQGLLARDEAAFGPLLAEDLVHVGFEGQIGGKAEYMAFFASGAWRYLEYRPSGVAVKLLGDVAVVTGRVDRVIRLEEKETRGAYAFTHVWSRVGGEWRLTSSQVSAIPQAPDR